VKATHYEFSYEVIGNNPNTIGIRVQVLNYVDDKTLDAFASASSITIPESMFKAFSDMRLNLQYHESRVATAQREFIYKMLDSVADSILEWFCGQNNIDRDSLKKWM